MSSLLRSSNLTSKGRLLTAGRILSIKSAPFQRKTVAFYGGYGYNNDYDNSYGSSGGSWGSSSERQSLPRNTIIKFVPQQEAWIVERMGKFHTMLEPGLNILMPFIDRIRYVKSLKETAIEVPSQSAITQDNVTLELDGVLYIRCVDPFKASYGVEDAEFAITQLAQTTMRAEIGQMTLDRTLAERAHLNANIVDAINSAAEDWGIRCLRYEIRDIHPPSKIVESMHQQVSAERTKRAQILESEGARQAAINVAEGRKQATILASEAEKAEKINMAAGEAEAILLRAKASAEGIERVARAIESNHGNDAVSMTVAEKYVEAFGKMAKEGTTMIVPASTNDAASMVTQALAIYNTINNKKTFHQKSSSNSPTSSSLTDSAHLKEAVTDMLEHPDKENISKHINNVSKD